MAVALDGLLDVAFDLPGGLQQQLVVAAVLGFEARRHARQRAAHCRHRQGTLGHPVAFVAHARAVAGKQAAGDFLAIAAQGADHPEGVEVSRHGVASVLRAVMW